MLDHNSQLCTVIKKNNIEAIELDVQCNDTHSDSIGENIFNSLDTVILTVMYQ